MLWLSDILVSYTKSRYMVGDNKNCTIPRKKRSMIFGVQIPNKKRIKINRQSSPLSPLQQSNLQQPSLQSNKNLPPSDATRKQEYFKILNKQADSTAPSHGEENLFIRLEGTTTLWHVKATNIARIIICEWIYHLLQVILFDDNRMVLEEK